MREAGGIRSENVDMSNESCSPNLHHPTSKVSCTMVDSAGLIGL